MSKPMTPEEIERAKALIEHLPKVTEPVVEALRGLADRVEGFLPYLRKLVEETERQQKGSDG